VNTFDQGLAGRRIVAIVLPEEAAEQLAQWADRMGRRWCGAIALDGWPLPQAEQTEAKPKLRAAAAPEKRAKADKPSWSRQKRTTPEIEAFLIERYGAAAFQRFGVAAISAAVVKRSLLAAGVVLRPRGGARKRNVAGGEPAAPAESRRSDPPVPSGRIDHEPVPNGRRSPFNSFAKPGRRRKGDVSDGDRALAAEALAAGKVTKLKPGHAFGAQSALRTDDWK
jgi:hypothetical protein